MSKKIFDAVAVIGTYTTKGGEEKKRYLNIGSVFENDKGQLSMKIDAMPVGEFNGWISFFTPKEQTPRPAPQTPNTRAPGSFEDFESDVPF